MAMPYGLKPEQFDRTTVKGAVTVRPLTAADRDEWNRLWALYLDFYRTSKPPSLYDLNWARLFDPDEPMFGYLAEIGGKPHGLVHIIMHRSFWLEGPSCYLQDLYADADLRGCQFGVLVFELADQGIGQGPHTHKQQQRQGRQSQAAPGARAAPSQPDGQQQQHRHAMQRLRQKIE